MEQPDNSQTAAESHRGDDAEDRGHYRRAFGDRRSPTSPPLTPYVASVGDIDGLVPLRRHPRSDGGQVPGGDVDVVDILPSLAWRTAAAWLQSSATIATRQTRLRDLAAFLRWMRAHHPHLGLLECDTLIITGYRDSITSGGALAGVARPGQALAPATVARRLSSLSSFYQFALHRQSVAGNPVSTVTRPQAASPDARRSQALRETAKLLNGADAIAAHHPADAAAVAVLTICALRVSELVALTVGHVIQDACHRVLIVRRRTGRIHVPVPPRAHSLVYPLLQRRPATAPLLTDQDGRPFNRWRVHTAFRRCARAADLDATKFTPEKARATAAIALLDSGVPLPDVQRLLGHSTADSTRRYLRTSSKLDGYATYQMAELLSREA